MCVCVCVCMYICVCIWNSVYQSHMTINYSYP